jgi:hypothetical protein
MALAKSHVFPQSFPDAVSNLNMIFAAGHGATLLLFTDSERVSDPLVSNKVKFCFEMQGLSSAETQEERVKRGNLIVTNFLAEGALQSVTDAVLLPGVTDGAFLW